MLLTFVSRVRVVTRFLLAATLVVPVAACTTSSATAGTPTTSTSTTVVTTPGTASANTPASSPLASSGETDQSRAYAAAAADIRAFLAAWETHGCAAAARRFLSGDEQSSGCAVTLTKGTLVSFTPYKWVSPDLFTGMAVLDLHFQGNRGAWGDGTNDRLVTIIHTAGTARLTFATGP